MGNIKSANEANRRRVIHVGFSIAVITLVLFGIYGPTATAAVGWLGMMAAAVAWLVFAVVEIRRDQKTTK